MIAATIITTCRGRLAHFQETLSSLKRGGDESQAPDQPARRAFHGL